jgi:hypothetical protein
MFACELLYIFISTVEQESLKYKSQLLLEGAQLTGQRTVVILYA